MKRATIGLLALLSIACGEMARQGTSSSYLIITTLEAASGAESGEFAGTLRSDVVTTVDRDGEQVQVIFDDLGRVGFQLALKDPGPPGAPTTPSPNNFVTIDRYRVRFIRSDGRNVEGVDVPYSFDGAFTVTVSDSANAGFTLVRHQAKLEAPLAALRAGAIFLSTIAEITFYGRDQTGREVSAKGNIGVNFGNFADPQ